MPRPSPRAGPNGTIIPEVSNVLSYVFTWTNVPCVASGGGGESGSPNSNPPVTVCVIMQAVDANTGALSAGQYQSGTP